MLSILEIKQFLKYYPPDQVDLVLALRDLIAEVAAGATEVIHTHTQYLSYYFSENRGGPVSAGICGIGLKDDGIQLSFPHGAFIPDPHNLLTGTGKAMRHLVLRSYESVPWDAVRELIREHANFDPCSFRMS